MKLNFNLNFGGENVRTFEDVRNQATNAREILSEIIKTFQEKEETEPTYVEVNFSLFDYFDGGNKFRVDFHPEQLSAKLENAIQDGSAKVIQEYFRGYEVLVQDIISHPYDLTYIYDRFDDMVAGYSSLLKLSSVSLFEHFLKTPLAAIALYAHSGTRPYYEKSDYLLRNLIMKNGSSWNLVPLTTQEMNDDFLENLKPHVKKFSSEHVSYEKWHRIEEPNKKCLILCSCTASYYSVNAFIASTDNHDNPVEMSSIGKGKFINSIFNGIDVKNDSGMSFEFYYMEAR